MDICSENLKWEQGEEMGCGDKNKIKDNYRILYMFLNSV